MTLYGILNLERNRMLTSASGRGTWEMEERAAEAMRTEFGGGDHLEVVEIRRID